VVEWPLGNAELADCGVVGAADDGADADAGICPLPLGWPGPAAEGAVISGARDILDVELFTATPSGEGWIWGCE